MTEHKKCPLCEGHGTRQETIVEYTRLYVCISCEGTGRVPIVKAWRPHEPVKK